MSHRGGARIGAGGPSGPKPHTVARAKAIQADRELTAQAVLEQIRRGGWFDIRKLFDEDGNYKPIHTLTEEEAFCIEGIDLVRGNVNKNDGKFDDVVKIRTIRRKDYVEMAAKYHGLLIERVKIEDDRPLRQKVADARKRLAAARAKA